MAKLANLAFATELARRQGGELLSSAVHPGVVASDMLRRGNFEAMLGRRLGSLPAERCPRDCREIAER